MKRIRVFCSFSYPELVCFPSENTRNPNGGNTFISSCLTWLGQELKRSRHWLRFLLVFIPKENFGFSLQHIQDLLRIYQKIFASPYLIYKVFLQRNKQLSIWNFICFLNPRKLRLNS